MYAVGVTTTNPAEVLHDAGADEVVRPSRATTSRLSSIGSARRDRIVGSAMRTSSDQGPSPKRSAWRTPTQRGRGGAMAIKRVAILGAGGMGTALAVLFDRRGKAVQLWSRTPEGAAAMAGSRENARHLPGVPLPESIGITPNACDATAAADLIVVAIPSSYLRATLATLAERMPARRADPERGQGDRERQLRPAEPDRRRAAGRAARRRPERAEPRRGDRAGAARVGRRAAGPIRV